MASFAADTCTGTVLLASKLLEQQHASSPSPEGTGPPGLSLGETQRNGYWTVLENKPYDGVNESPFKAPGMMHRALGGPLRVLTERRVPLFPPSSMNRPWAKPQTDPKLCRFSLQIIRRVPPTTDAPQLQRSVSDPHCVENPPLPTSTGTSTRLGALPRHIRPSYEPLFRASAGQVERFRSGSPMSLFMTLKSHTRRTCASQSPLPGGLFSTRNGGRPLQFRDQSNVQWKKANGAAVTNAPIIRRPPRGTRLERTRCGHTRH